MPVLLAVAVGGALGALARYLSMHWIGLWLGTGFPFGTLAVNIAGSFAMAVVVEGLASMLCTGAEWRAFLVVGLLGSLTTFSTFSHDVAILYEKGQFWTAAGYVGASVTLSVIALFSGLWLTRSILA